MSERWYHKPIRIVSTKEEARNVPVNEIGLMQFQHDLVFSDVPYTALITGRGAGKTHGGVDCALKETGARRCTGTIASPTFPMLERSLLPLFLREFEGLISNFDKQRLTATLLNGSVVYMVSLEKPEKACRGLNNTWFWMEEARECRTDHEWKLLLATLRESETGCRGWVTTTPAGKSHWLYEKFGTGKPGYRLIQAHTDDNLFTSDEFKEALKMEYGVGYFARQELAGEFVDPTGDIFQPEWFNVSQPNGTDFRYEIRGWDLAASTKERADFTCGVKLGVCHGQDVWILDVVRWKQSWAVAKEMIKDVIRRDGAMVVQNVEAQSMQLGYVDELKKELPGYTIRGVTRERDKMSYALPVATRAQQGHLFLKEASWNDLFIDEHVTFDGTGKKGHDDQVDATANAFRSLLRPRPEIFEWDSLNVH